MATERVRRFLDRPHLKSLTINAPNESLSYFDPIPNDPPNGRQISNQYSNGYAVITRAPSSTNLILRAVG